MQCATLISILFTSASPRDRTRSFPPRISLPKFAPSSTPCTSSDPQRRTSQVWGGSAEWFLTCAKDKHRQHAGSFFYNETAAVSSFPNARLQSPSPRKPVCHLNKCCEGIPLFVSMTAIQIRFLLLHYYRHPATRKNGYTGISMYCQARSSCFLHTQVSGRLFRWLHLAIQTKLSAERWLREGKPTKIHQY